MLNEYLEFEEYTSLLFPTKTDVDTMELGDNIYGRIQLKTLTDRDGLKRILIIICRRFIHHDLNDIKKIISINKDNVSERIALGLRAIQEYTSYKPIDEPLDPYLVHSRACGKYFGYLLDIKEIHQKLDERFATDEWSIENRNQTTYRMIYNDLSRAEFDWQEKFVPNRLAKDFYGRGNGLDSKYENAIISYDLIVADALHMGPLNHFNVAIPITTIERLHDIAFPKYTIALTDFLYTLALYMTLKNQNDNEYQVISYPNMSNWLRKSGYYKNFNKFKEPLQKSDLLAEDIISNSSKKIAISDELTSECYVIDMMDQNDIEISPDYLVITDDIPYADVEMLIKEKHTSYHKSIIKKAKKKPNPSR